MYNAVFNQAYYGSIVSVLEFIGMSRQGNATQSLNASRRSGLTKKNSRKKTRDLIRTEEAENFAILLDHCGIQISQLSYAISCDIASFTRLFTSKLSSLPVSLDLLQGEIEYHMGTEDRLKASMEPINYSGPPECSLSNMGQPTLMRLLLDILCLQPFIISLLLTKLEEHATSLGQEELNEMTNLILSQLRWISKLVKPREFSTRILKVLASSPLSLKRLVVLCLPDIVEDSEHTFVAQQLKDLLANVSLTAIIIDTISNFNLAPDLMEEFRDAAFSMLTSVSCEDLEFLLKFLLHATHQEESDEVVSHLRSSEIFMTTRDPNRNVIIIQTLESVLRFQPLIFESWLRYIEQSPCSDVTAVDLCTLCVMHGVGYTQGRIQSALRAKLKQGMSMEPILEDLPILSHCLSKNHASLFTLFQTSFISNDSDFTSDLMRSLFLAAESPEQQFVLDFILESLRLDPQLEPMPPLTLLNSLAESDTEKLTPFTSQLQALYTELHTFSQNNMTQLFQLTATLALHTTSTEEHYLDDTYHEAVNSLLRNGNESLRNVGVTGVSVGIRVLLEKYTTANLNDTQLRRLTKPVLLLKQILSSHPSSLALFYSELASIVRTAGGNEKFLSWVITGLEKEFVIEFMVEVNKEEFEDIPGLTPCLILGLSPGKPRLALKLLSLVHGLQLNKLDRTRDPRCLFSLLPQLQLLSICCRRLNGNLQQIEYILTAPTLLIQQDLLVKPDQFSNENSHLIVSSLLILFAWLCELINIYATVVSGESQSPVFKCLSQLILVERLLHKYGTQLSSLPKYISQPVLQVVTATHPEQVSSPENLHKHKHKHKHMFLDKIKTGSDKQQFVFVPSPLYEQLSLQSLMLIQVDLDREELINSTSDHFWNKLPVSLEECTFLFRAFKHKLDKLFPSRQFGFNNQSSKKLVPDDQLAAVVSDIFPHLCSYLELVDMTPDGSMDTSEIDFFQTQSEIDFISILFSCLETIFHLISHYKDTNKFDTVLKEISHIYKLNSDQLLLGREELVLNSIAYLDSLLFRGNIFTFVQPVCKIYSYISLLSEKPRTKQSISNSLGKILKHEWSHYGSSRQSPFEDIVKLYIHFHESPLLAIEEITGTAIPELLLEDATKSQLFPTLNTSTMYTFYKVLFSELVNDLKSLQEPPFRSTDSMDLHIQRLFKLEISVRLFSILVNIVKSFDGRLYLATALRSSRYYIDTFLKLGMPLLDFIFRDKNSEVTCLLKSFQQGTRCLQHYCTHSKNLKDVSLTRYVPPLRKSLETFLFRVKAMLGANNCTDAFTIGNLKNKNLQGDVIESQSMDTSLDSIHTDI